MLRKNIHKKYLITIGLIVILYGLRDMPVHAKKWKYMAETSISWRAYGEAAFVEARKTNRPLFVLIFADWCEWCRKYEVEAIETAAIRKRSDRDYIPVAVDQVKQPGLARRLGAKLVPTTLLLTPDGKNCRIFTTLPVRMTLPIPSIGFWRCGARGSCHMRSSVIRRPAAP